MRKVHIRIFKRVVKHFGSRLGVELSMEAVRLSRFANISYCHCCFLEVLKYMFLFGDFLEQKQNKGVI